MNEDQYIWTVCVSCLEDSIGNFLLYAIKANKYRFASSGWLLHERAAVEEPVDAQLYLLSLIA